MIKKKQVLDTFELEYNNIEYPYTVRRVKIQNPHGHDKCSFVSH